MCHQPKQFRAHRCISPPSEACGPEKQTSDGSSPNLSTLYQLLARKRDQGKMQAPPKAAVTTLSTLPALMTQAPETVRDAGHACVPSAKLTAI